MTAPAYSQILEDETGPTAARFMVEAASFFAGLGVTIQRVLTDNAKAYTDSVVFLETAADLGIRLKRTRPYRPQTNGKVERYHRTLKAEWAYRRPYASNTERREAFQAWLDFYNHRRPHSALNGLTPMAVLVNNVHGNHTLGRVGRCLELGDINLAHLEHRLHGAARTLRIGISNQLVQLARHDLPRQPESVFEPSAGARLASVRGERIPHPVDLRLVLALDDERNRLVEAEVRPAVEALEVLAVEREVDRQDHPGRPAGRVGGGAPDLVDAAVGQQARVEPGRLLGLAIEPEAGKGVPHLVLL
jgi:hypothetical protein